MSINSLFIKQSEEFKNIMLKVPYNIIGKRILELGPLVGIHTYTLQNMGAKEVIAIEGREENYKKCLENKRIYNMDKCKFILGNIKEENLEELGHFDLCVASKIFHHLNDPLEVFKKISKTIDNIYLFYRVATDTFPQGHMVYYYNYKGRICPEGNSIFSGLQEYSIWLFKEDLLRLLNDVGFSNIYIVKEDEEQSFIPNIKCKYIILLASKENIK